MRHRFALAAFTLCAFLGLLSGGIFVQGLLRDRHAGDPELPLELARVSQWSDVGFLFLGLAALLSPVTGHPRVTVTLSVVLLLALAWLLTG